MLLSSGDSFLHLIQKLSSQLGFLTYLLNYPVYLLRVVPVSCSETCPLLSQGGNEVIFMIVEEDVDVKEEDIPVAVKTLLQQK